MRVQHRRARSQNIIADDPTLMVGRLGDHTIRFMASNMPDRRYGAIVDLTPQELYRGISQIPFQELVAKLGTAPEARRFMDDLAKVLGVKTP